MTEADFLTRQVHGIGQIIPPALRQPVEIGVIVSRPERIGGSQSFEIGFDIDDTCFFQFFLQIRFVGTVKAVDRVTDEDDWKLRISFFLSDQDLGQVTREGRKIQPGVISIVKEEKIQEDEFLCFFDQLVNFRKNFLFLTQLALFI